MNSIDLFAQKTTDTFTVMFTEVLFVTGKTWQHPKCVVMENWLNKLENIHTVKYFTNVKK